MDTSPNLQLAYLMAAQSQKHVTYNEAMRALDALVQQMVLDKQRESANAATLAFSEPSRSIPFSFGSSVSWA
jgi:hypothetical protein